LLILKGRKMENETMNCPHCGQSVEIIFRGSARSLKTHSDDSGYPCPGSVLMLDKKTWDKPVIKAEFSGDEMRGIRRKDTMS
jgi:hypothetical protein